MTSLAADQSALADQACELVDDVVRACPAHRAGTRPIHAPGIAATGWFSATPVASTFTTAAHFSGRRILVTVRFSNGTGDSDEPDSTPQVRGMAVKFHLGVLCRDEWGVLHSEDETDLIGMTMPMFFARDVADFRAFVDAARPVPAARRSWRQKVLGQLRLDTPFPTVAPGEVSNEPGVFDYASRHPEACPAAVFLGAKFVPESYTTCCYHAVHAFAISAPDSTHRWARFHWEPVDGVRSASPEACRLRGGERFLRDGLKDQIVNGRAEFVLRMELAEQGDDPTDPTRPWSQRRPRVVMGHLRLTDVPEDQWHGGELLSFNPTRLVPGIGLSADPTLNIRGEVYRVSSARRQQAAHLPPASSNPVQT
ncbi:MAG: catalase [Acidimicrobiaceae bacterium]|jgi:catalase|nr:catalase [Acidimicrobiaceae bacterium]